MADRELQLKVTANTRDAQQGLKLTSREISQVERSADRATGSTKQLATSLDRINRAERQGVITRGQARAARLQARFQGAQQMGLGRLAGVVPGGGMLSTAAAAGPVAAAIGAGVAGLTIGMREMVRALERNSQITQQASALGVQRESVRASRGMERGILGRGGVGTLNRTQLRNLAMQQGTTMPEALARTSERLARIQDPARRSIMAEALLGAGGGRFINEAVRRNRVGRLRQLGEGFGGGGGTAADQAISDVGADISGIIDATREDLTPGRIMRDLSTGGAFTMMEFSDAVFRALMRFGQETFGRNGGDSGDSLAGEG